MCSEGPVKAFGYIRCSTSEQVVEGLSLQAQRSRIAAWCEMTGLELVEVIEDGGVSDSLGRRRKRTQRLWWHPARADRLRSRSPTASI